MSRPLHPPPPLSPPLQQLHLGPHCKAHHCDQIEHALWVNSPAALVAAAAAAALAARVEPVAVLAAAVDAAAAAVAAAAVAVLDAQSALSL
eukprot:scaffold61373_cov15-Tisochrysis_lutea.AAC.1